MRNPETNDSHDTLDKIDDDIYNAAFCYTHIIDQLPYYGDIEKYHNTCNALRCYFCDNYNISHEEFNLYLNVIYLEEAEYHTDLEIITGDEYESIE